jgi:predicted  nucleic acid-binding Zn-ribbon protein
MKPIPPLLPLWQTNPGRLMQTVAALFVFMGAWTVSSNCLGLHCHQTQAYFTQALIWWPNFFVPLLLDFPDNGFWTVFITATFIALIATLFISVILYDIRRWQNSEELADAPRTFTLYLSENAGSIMTSLGILGTFLGLALGTGAVELSEASDRTKFLGQHFQEIKKLMLTLSLAFWSSVAGIGGAIGIKIIKGFFSNLADQPTDMISVMDTHSNAVCGKLESIDTSIRGQRIIPAQEIAEAITIVLKAEFSNHFSQLSHAATDCAKASRECTESMRDSTSTFCETMQNGSTNLEKSIQADLNLLEEKFEELAKSMESATKASRETLEISRNDHTQLHHEAKIINAQLRATTQSYDQMRKKIEGTVLKLHGMVRNYRKTINYDRDLRDAVRKMGGIPEELDRLHNALIIRMRQQEKALKKHGFDLDADLKRIRSTLDDNNIVELETVLERLLQNLRDSKESE